MQQYFVKGLPSDKSVTIVDKDTVKHMFQVMRLKVDEQVILVFDDGVKRLSKVVDVEEKKFEILEELPDSVELPVNVTIASAFPKGDKLEFIAQKTTELGASAIWSFPSDWAVAKWDGKKLAKKATKLEKIVQGAAEQSKRNRVPEVKLFEKKQDFISNLSQFDRVFVAYEESAKEGEKSALAQTLAEVKSGENILFIFGPEGGISPAEIEQFEQEGASLVGLGPRIMRAETAPLYALSAVSYALELN